MIRPLCVCFSGHKGHKCESGRKKKKAAGLLQVKEGDKASPLNLSFFFCKNEISLRGRSTNSQGRPKGTDLSLVIRVQIVPVPNC